MADTAAAAVFTLAGEVVGVTVLALVAGTSQDAGHAVVMLMLAFWLIYLVTDGSAVIGGILTKFQKASAEVG